MNQDLLLILVIILVLAVLLRAWTRQRAARRVGQRPQAARPAAEADAPATTPSPTAWLPPRYEAVRDATAGPSLRVAINIVRASETGLLVSWNATNNGSLPVAVQWGAAGVVVENDLLQLRYTQESAASFAPPDVRICQPGEILSRSAAVAREAIGQEPKGMRVIVAVGYGNANEYEDACAEGGAYLDWQRVAVSPPRIVPRG